MQVSIWLGKTRVLRVMDVIMDVITWRSLNGTRWTKANEEHDCILLSDWDSVQVKWTAIMQLSILVTFGSFWSRLNESFPVHNVYTTTHVFCTMTLVCVAFYVDDSKKFVQNKTIGFVVDAADHVCVHANLLHYHPYTWALHTSFTLVMWFESYGACMEGEWIFRITRSFVQNELVF